MASCIPAIPDCPLIRPSPGFPASSVEAARSQGGVRINTGLDFAMKIGNPVYATGDGVVEAVKFEFFGYGNSITIDHGLATRRFMLISIPSR